MAASQKERTRCEREKGRNSPLLSSWCLVLVAAALMVLLGGQMSGDATSVTTNVTMVVTKSLLVGSCVDSLGNEVADLGEWTTGCNKIVCHVEPSGNYTVTHGCRGLVPSENPDDVNCVAVENTAAAYPDCCPYLDCGSASGISTVNPSLCVDLGASSSCQVWKLLTNNCTTTTAFVYNFTVQFCQATCGFCSGGTG